MRIKPECIPCILTMSIAAMSRLTDNTDMIRDFTTKILEIQSLRGANWDLTAPEIVETILLHIADIVKTPDPFGPLKAEQNLHAMQLYPWIREQVLTAPDPLYLAVNLAILGNSIDAMKYQESMDIKSLIQDRLESPVSRDVYLQFRQKIKNSKRIAYLGDNSGEIFFDKVLIETLKKENIDIVLILRSEPTLNDVTIAEQGTAGMDKMVSVIENGIDGPLPGTMLARCSNEVRRIIQKADLIISKGGGNFDSLDEEHALNKDVSFMLIAKCLPYCRQFNAKLNEPVLMNRYGH